jgi:Na+/proline symporter
MQLALVDWIVILLFFAVTLIIGLWASRKSGSSSSEFFLGGRSMPWWLLGVSMVATTFSADTPNLVTDIVRQHGVAGNWAWWAFLLTGMLTVFVYAKLWRRSGITTDLEFYELRYSGKAARFLRAFRAVYLGVFFNVMIMATVLLAGIKIGGVMLGLSAWEVILYVSAITVVYSAIGGFRGVILTDFFQFLLAMTGMVWACLYILDLPQVGGLDNLLAQPAVQGKLDFLPDFGNPAEMIPLFLVPIAVQWWSVWYPGAEPGGGGYIAQRMLSARNEQHAVTATLLFNIAHYALRPWPWILIALASLVVFPTVADIGAAFPGIPAEFVRDDLAFSAMLTFLPAGLIGLLVAALLAALMSTISTHLNWGSSYMVNDVYRRFVKPDATEQEMVRVGRYTTVVLMILASLMALLLSSALQAFNILLQIGAGTGLLFILRWFWWRINAMSELTAMGISFLVALIMEFGVGNAWAGHVKLVAGVAITTVVWIAATLATKPTDMLTLVRFYALIRPHGAGWRPVIEAGQRSGELPSGSIVTGKLANEILLMLLGCFLVYGLLFGIGSMIYGQAGMAVVWIAIAAVSGTFMYLRWPMNG